MTSATPDSQPITELVTGVLQASGEGVDRMVETARILRQQRPIAF
jgi:hypothetical protein